MIKFTKVKSKNKKGFAMAELLAVCIVVLTIFTILFSNYLPLVAEYENRSVYNNVTAQYAAHHFRKTYAEAIASTANKVDTQNIEKNIIPEIESKGFFTIYKLSEKESDINETIFEHLKVAFGGNSIQEKEIKKLLSEYGIEEIIITSYKLTNDEKTGLKDKLGDEDGGYPKEGKLYGYINYLPTYKNYSGDETYRIILKSSEFGYATTPIKYKDISGEQGNKPNHPVLSENMFAVRYFTGTEGSECVSGNSCWKVVSGDEKDRDNWYNYDVGEWANSITVKDSVREEYKVLESNGVGKEVNMDDVLTMQVWIPRFKYTVWNYNSSGTTYADLADINYKYIKEEGITINFEKPTEKGDIICKDAISGETGDGTSETCFVGSEFNSCNNDSKICNGKTYTHPAFTFGDDELTGFWVGKFEISPIEDSVCYTSMSVSNCNQNVDITVLPSKKAYRYAQISTFANNMMAMNDNDNMYGFASTDDVHMIKNMEWGAVTYLSHSKYGICGESGCKEVVINGYNGRLTGCGSTSAACDSYEADGVLSSTTGNIYGVYDMNGGTSEYVMGNMIDGSGTTMMVGQKEVGTMLSGYSGMLFDSDGENKYIEYTGIDYPDKKYVDKYSFTNDDFARKATKLGDGIKETIINTEKSWYNDKSSTLYAPTGRVWYTRGGAFDASDEAGIFYSFGDAGYPGRLYTSRLVIANVN